LLSVTVLTVSPALLPATTTTRSPAAVPRGDPAAPVPTVTVNVVEPLAALPLQTS
jgi:hypothetical protein